MVNQVIQESAVTLELKASQVIQGLKASLGRQGIREFKALAVIPASLVVLVIQGSQEFLVTAELKESAGIQELVDSLASQVFQELVVIQAKKASVVTQA